MKKKESSNAAANTSPKPIAAVTEDTEGSATLEPVTNNAIGSAVESSLPIAVVTEINDRKLETSETTVQVSKLNNNNCELLALIDTGSPVSFIQSSIIHRFFKDKDIHIDKPVIKYQSISGDHIPITGVISTQICLPLLPNFVGDINLLVSNNAVKTADIIIGCDFLTKHKIKVCLNLANQDRNNKVQLFNEIAFVQASVEAPVHQIHTVITDFGPEIDCKISDLIEETERTKVTLLEDDHAVKVILKDNSIYSYSPRPMPQKIKQQIREIIDDLLLRKIVKPSISPYCARIVPVHKRNGTLRLCVDLRPLKERVVKQKCPFPLIEDCLSRLSNKTIFTLLDLKDEFHNIKIHPNHTKYFSFATSDGQYEYTMLPFGYCEAPAEFQK